MSDRHNTTPEQEAAWAAEKAECAARYRTCRSWYATRDRERIAGWLNELDPAERERCRAVLNDIREARRP